MRSSAEAIVAPVLPADTIALAFAVAHQFGRAHERGVLLSSHAGGRVVVHGDDLGAGKDLETERVTEQFGHADQDDREAEFVDGGASPGDDLLGSEVATHRVQGDGQAQLS